MSNKNQDRTDLIAFLVIVTMCFVAGLLALADLPTKAEIKAHVVEIQTKGVSK